MKINSIAECKECGSPSLTWQTKNINRGGAPDGRLKAGEIECQFFLGCDDCSATLAVISADRLAHMMNEERRKAQLPVDWRHKAWPIIDGPRAGEQVRSEYDSAYLLASTLPPQLGNTPPGVASQEAIRYYLHPLAEGGYGWSCKATPEERPWPTAQSALGFKIEVDKNLPANTMLITGAAPKRFPCWSCQEPVSLEERADHDGNCPHCRAELDLVEWPKQ